MRVPATSSISWLWACVARVLENAMTKLNEKDRDELGEKQFAFEKQRKEPLENASHVRNAVARFNQVEGVTDAERDAAWKRIQSAARKFNVDLHESSWREIGHHKR
jgi:hypothetical protein